MSWCLGGLTLTVTSSIRIKDLPNSERPRERLAEMGADALSHAELIAILLRVGLKGMSAVDVGKQIVQKFGTLDNLSRASLDDLQKVKGVGRDKAIALKAAFTLAQRMAKELQQESPVLDNPETIAHLLREENRLYDVEHFQVLLLNTRRKLIRIDQVSQGTLDSLMVHPREIFRSAISANASA
ncbi:MAG: RadC family protein, partial [Limisphaerales bacterium]